jgi:hypothetical protein
LASSPSSPTEATMTGQITNLAAQAAIVERQRAAAQRRRS